MMKQKASVETISDLLEDDHAETLKKVDRLRDVLTHLRYEGRLFFGKNLRAAREVLGFFKKDMVKHVDREEKVLFPFLETHFPKLETAIQLFKAEHRDFRANLRVLQSQLEKLSGASADPSRGLIIEKIRETGTYLTYLLRNHMQAESESLYKVIDRQIRQEEKKELVMKIQRREGHGSSREK